MKEHFENGSVLLCGCLFTEQELQDIIKIVRLLQGFRDRIITGAPLGAFFLFKGG